MLGKKEIQREIGCVSSRNHYRLSMTFLFAACTKNDQNFFYFRWSFGVLLWEMFSCQFPYDEEEDTENCQDLVQWLHRGKRLKKPSMASQKM